MCVRVLRSLSRSPMTPSPCLLHIFFLHAQREREITAAANKWSCCRCRCYLVGSLAKRALDHQLRRRRRRRSAGGQRSGKVHCHIGKTFTTLSVCVCVCRCCCCCLVARAAYSISYILIGEGMGGCTSKLSKICFSIFFSPSHLLYNALKFAFCFELCFCSYICVYDR